jgi:hypothetical protein
MDNYTCHISYISKCRHLIIKNKTIYAYGYAFGFDSKEKIIPYSFIIQPEITFWIKKTSTDTGMVWLNKAGNLWEDYINTLCKFCENSKGHRVVITGTKVDRQKFNKLCNKLNISSPIDKTRLLSNNRYNRIIAEDINIKNTEVSEKLLKYLTHVS